MYTILKVHTDGRTEVKEIGETLADLQAEVGGPIEQVRLFARPDPLAIVNEEGRLIGLPENRLFLGLVGDLFFINAVGEGFKSLTDSQIHILRKLLGR